LELRAVTIKRIADAIPCKPAGAVSFRAFRARRPLSLLSGAALLILLSFSVKAFELSTFQRFAMTNQYSYEKVGLVFPVENEVTMKRWIIDLEPGVIMPQDLHAVSEPDAVDTTSPNGSVDMVLAGFVPAGLFSSTAASGDAQYGGGWMLALLLMVAFGLLVMMTKYVVSRNSAVELERVVDERTRQLEKSADQYRSLVQNAMVGIFRVNADGLIETSNPALVKILRCTSEEKLLGRSLRDDIFIDSDQWDQIRNLQSVQGWVSGVEMDWSCCDGGSATVRLSGRWVNVGDNNLVCELIVEDITALANARVAELEAERLRGVQKLAIAVAHEFNNPLSILLGTYQLYVRPNIDQYDPDTRARLERLPETVSRMRGLVTRLLRITKLRENEYLHGASYLNLDQSAGDEESVGSIEKTEDVLGGTGRTFASFS